MYKLPVTATIRETYRFIGAQLSPLVDYAIVPVVFGAVFATFLFFGAFAQTSGAIDLYGVAVDAEQIAKLPQFASQLPTNVKVMLSFAAAIAGLALYILFAVAWHRRYLLGPTATSPREIFAWRDRHWRFLGNLILVALIILLAAIVMAVPLYLVLKPLLGSMGSGSADPAARILPALIVNIILGIPIALIACRYTLVFPAIAADRAAFGLGQSALLTRGNLWRILGVLFFGFYLPYGIASAGVGELIFSPLVLKLWIGSIGLGFVVLMFQQLLLYVGVAIGVSALSIIYRKLVDNTPAAPGPAGSRTT